MIFTIKSIDPTLFKKEIGMWDKLMIGLLKPQSEVNKPILNKLNLIYKSN